MLTAGMGATPKPDFSKGYSNVSPGQLARDGFLPVAVKKQDLPAHLNFDIEPPH